MIRKAVKSDVAQIVGMARKFYATTDYSSWADFCEETVRDLTESMVENHLVLVAEKEGRLVGVVGLFVAPFMFNKRKTGAYEVVWWVDPEQQNAGVGSALLDAVVPACEEMGCNAVQMVHLRNSPPQASEIYKRMGYMHTESSYTRVL